MRVSVHVYLTEAEHEALASWAAERRMSMSAAAGLIITRQLDLAPSAGHRQHRPLTARARLSRDMALEAIPAGRSGK